MEDKCLLCSSHNLLDSFVIELSLTNLDSEADLGIHFQPLGHEKRLLLLARVFQELYKV